MQFSKVLQDYRFPSQAQDILLASGIKELYPPQAEAIKRGILDGKNLLMAVPTAAGKTLMAELCMLKSLLFNDGRCLYIAPLKALASEKYTDFKNKYTPLGIRVGLAIGDLDTPSQHLSRYQIIIATAEKVDSLLRSRAPWLIEHLNVVILDEIHFINDGSRGPTLEILATRIKQLNPRIQFLALSATVSNADQMAQWLNAEAVVSDFRPIPLREGVYFNQEIIFRGHGKRLIREDTADDLAKLTLDTLRGKGQVLVFVNSRRSAQAASRELASSVTQILTSEERKALTLLAKKAAGAPSDATKICHKLADVLAQGVAFHHAGLKPNQRELIENNFRTGLIKVICSTPTLAAGVNLPARRAIIRDVKRYESGVGAAYIPASEYKQCAGRAGRPQYDPFGEAVLMAKSSSEMRALFERYIDAPTEPILSKLGEESVLRVHILSSIAGGYVHDVHSMLDFLSHTFFYHQRQARAWGDPQRGLLELVSRVFDFLHEGKFIEKSGFRFFPTTFGSLTTRLYIDPVTSLMIRDGLKAVSSREAFPPLGMLHCLCCTPDSPLLHVGKNDGAALEKFAGEFSDQWIFTPATHPDIIKTLEFLLSTLKTVWMLGEWMEENKEEHICDQFGVGPGDIYRYVETIQWLIYAAGRMAELFGYKRMTFSIGGLRTRARYGVKEELLDLVQLKGIGRIRARQLYNHGFKKLTDFRMATMEQLISIPQIGRAAAMDILTQTTETVRV